MLELFPDLPLKIEQLNPDQSKWIAARLTVGGYLSIAKPSLSELKSAFALFKKDMYQTDPDLLGNGSLELLQELQAPYKAPNDPTHQKPLPNAGSLTGVTAVLPKVGRIFANQFVIPNVPLTWGEWFRYDFSRLTNDVDLIDNILHFTRNIYKPIREEFGSPLIINSAFRPKAVNDAVGGAKNSFHLYCKAIDATPFNGNLQGLHQAAIDCGFSGGLGIAKTFRHFDSGSKRVWRYSDR